MKETKLIILQTAMKLFNRDGVTEITLRKLASEIGMSQGNLTYHYQKREQIVELLFDNYAQEISYSLNSMEESSIDGFFEFITQILQIHTKYRFIINERSHIIRSAPVLRDKFHRLSNQLYNHLGQTIDNMITEGVMLNETYDSQNAHFIRRIIMLLYVTPNVELMGVDPFGENDDKESLRKIIEGIIYHHLTDKGKIIFLKHMKLI